MALYIGIIAGVAAAALLTLAIVKMYGKSQSGRGQDKVKAEQLAEMARREKAASKVGARSIPLNPIEQRKRLLALRDRLYRGRN
jgi:hypothetical protein